MSAPDNLRNAEISKNEARATLAVFALAVILCLMTALTPDPDPPFVPPSGTPGDLTVFRRVVNAVGAGESFYDATQREFRGGGYPTRSVFNWRTPCYAWFLGRLTGDEGGRWVLMSFVITGVVMCSRHLIEDCGLLPGSLGAVMVVGSTAWCFGGPTVYFTEVWAGALILLSLCAFRRGRTLAGVMAGIAAVCYRELSVLYALVSLILAYREGRRREVALWSVGLVLCAALFAVHGLIITSRLTPVDQAMQGGWVRFGGVRFLLATAQSNVFLMARPLWLTALYLPISCLGLSGMRGESGRRVALTGLAYLSAFSIVGCPFNFYWGFLTAPILAIGVAFAPGELVSLVLAARLPRWEPRITVAGR